jgi:hypothetical protein
MDINLKLKRNNDELLRTIRDKKKRMMGRGILLSLKPCF